MHTRKQPQTATHDGLKRAQQLRFGRHTLQLTSKHNPQRPQPQTTYRCHCTYTTLQPLCQHCLTAGFETCQPNAATRHTPRATRHAHATLRTRHTNALRAHPEATNKLPKADSNGQRPTTGGFERPQTATKGRKRPQQPMRTLLPATRPLRLCPRCPFALSHPSV